MLLTNKWLSDLWFEFYLVWFLDLIFWYLGII
jgi:hypothetical protein